MGISLMIRLRFGTRDEVMITLLVVTSQVGCMRLLCAIGRNQQVVGSWSGDSGLRKSFENSFKTVTFFLSKSRPNPDDFLPVS
jgi:hypothetical protein